MKKLVLLSAVVLGLAGFIGIKTAEAAFINFNWETKSLFGPTNPQMYQQSVFMLGSMVGPNFTPAKGGVIAVLDITDRTKTQIGWLNQDFGGDYLGGKRFSLRFTSSTAWMKDQLYKRGFITVTWNQVRGIIWDRQLKRTLAGVEARYSDQTGRLEDACMIYCDYEACAKVGRMVSDIHFFCECEEYQGRTFCRKPNKFIYSDVPDYDF